MSNKPIQYVLSERQSQVGKLKGKTVLQAIPTGRSRVSFRNLCTEISRNTTFAPEEVAAVINLMTKIAKVHVENGDIVELGDLGTLTPGFRSQVVEKTAEGDKAFNANVHITKPTVKFSPSRKYFELHDVSYERTEPKASSGKGKKPAGSGRSSTLGGGSSSGSNPIEGGF